MNLLLVKMTRRKQNAPKRLKGSEKIGRSLATQQSVNSSIPTSDSEAEDGEAEEGDGETASDDENKDNKCGEAARTEYTSRSSAETLPSSGGSESHSSVVSLNKEPNHSRNTNRVKPETAGDDVATASSSQGTVSSHLSQQLDSALTRSSHTKMPASNPGLCSINKYKHPSRVTPPAASQSSASTAPGLDAEMAAVMSSLPSALLSRDKSPLESTIMYVSAPVASQQSDQPLDLSRKSERASSSRDRTVASKNHDPSGCSGVTIPSCNGFSSLQSLQQKFGGDYPLGLSLKVGPAVIPLQPSVNIKSAAPASVLTPPLDSQLRGGLGKPKPAQNSDWQERQEIRTSVSSPVLKTESSRYTSPISSGETLTEVGGKHTIHRCSCQKSFSTLYALSLHLQETGHSPGSSKALSLMDYPKLVRGQDMWLNQESEQTRRILRCMQCGESFRSLPLLTVHMMQTQHYTKIVSSDHGRRSHKCSTYCDRELDRECIFKCKVCQEAFTDMEGLANHMIVSGHHKKQSSSHSPGAALFSADISSVSRQGKKKRYLPEDVTTGNSSFTVASLIEYKQKQTVKTTDVVNGFHTESKHSSDSRSPGVQASRLVACDSCGKHVTSQDFHPHVRACLRQRAEVIDALRNKLALEEALLSRSENKLLRAGFNLSLSSSESKKKELPSSEDHERAFPEHNSQAKSDIPSPEAKSVSKNSGTSAKICDLIDMPVKTWYSSANESRQAARRMGTRSYSSEKSPELPVKTHESLAGDFSHKSIKQEDIDEEVSQDLKSSNKSAPSTGKMEPNLTSCGVSNRRELHQRLSPNVAAGSAVDSSEFTSSALHKLDMFSRGLKLSPPQRSISSDSKLLPNHSAKLSRKKEHSLLISKSPQSMLSSPLSELATESPASSRKDVTFDIIDPNSVLGDMEPTSSVLEAMESFIEKSFSSKSDIHSSNLASMFSPFRNCFPLAGQSGPLQESSEKVLSHFVRFSKFFRMIPGVGAFPEVVATLDNSRPLLDNIKSGLDKNKMGVSTPAQPEQHLGASLSKNISHSKKVAVRPHSSSSSIRIPTVKNLQDPAPAVTFNDTHDALENERVDSVSVPKKYKCISASHVDSVASHTTNHSLCKDSSQSSSSSGGILKNISLKCDPLSSLTGLENLTTEMARKRKHESTSETVASKRRVVKSHNIAKDETEIRYIKTEITHSAEDEKLCDEDSNLCSEEGRSSASSLSLSLSPKIFHQGSLTVSVEEDQSLCNDFKKAATNGEIVKDDADHDLVKVEMPAGLNINHDIWQQDIHTHTSDSETKDSPDIHKTGESLLENGTKGSSLRYEVKDHAPIISKDALPRDNFTSLDASFGKRNGFEKIGRDAGDGSGYNCDADIDTDDDCSDDGSRSLCVRKNKERRKDKIKETRSVVEDVVDNAEEENLLKLKINNTMSVNKIKDGDVGHDKDNDDRYFNNSFKETGKKEADLETLCSYNHHIDNNSVDENGDNHKMEITASKCEPQDKQRQEETLPTQTTFCEMSHSSDSEKKCKLPEEGQSHKCERGSGPEDLGSSQEFVEFLPKSETIFTSEKLGQQSKSKSALDSLSSFVYNQPLATEHPLDSLQRLLSTSDLTKPPMNSENHPLATSYKCLTPDPTTPMNLSSKSGVSSGGCSSDDNEEDDSSLTGGASEGDLRDYRCAACNRKFASKGSYRYHLSRCHLSSVKKYGIKEAFNMSPYVYLPLDHTSRFSKYYQMAHELANKGK